MNPLALNRRTARNLAELSKQSGPTRRRFPDPKFCRHPARYVAQCGIATLAVLIVLVALDHMKHTVLIASLGASTFIAFTMPHVESSRPRYLIGGYIVGTCVGCFWSAATVLLGPAMGGALDGAPVILFGAVATGSAIFLMVVTQTEHPPAAALALGYVLNEWDLLTVIVVLAGITAISLIKESSKPILTNLL